MLSSIHRTLKLLFVGLLAAALLTGCALLPETSCEEFNRFLDRGLVVGTFADPTLGYFSTST